MKHTTIIYFHGDDALFSQFEPIFAPSIGDEVVTPTGKIFKVTGRSWNPEPRDHPKSPKLEIHCEPAI